MDEYDNFQKTLDNVEEDIKKIVSDDSITSTSSIISDYEDIGDDFNLSREELSDFISSRTIKWLGQHGIKSLLRDLKVDIRSGISTVPFDIKLRKEELGTNDIPSPPRRGLFKIFFNALKDPILIALIIFAFISAFLGLGFPEKPEERVWGWVDGTAILVAVLIVSVVTTFNDFQKERKFKKLNKVSKGVERNQVIRDGVVKSVLTSEVLVGDIVSLSTGDKIPADGVLFECHGLSTDESSMTGESPLRKKDLKRDPFVISGTTIGEGCGKMIVCAVGLYSEWGKVLLKITEEKRTKTPLEERLNSLASIIGKIGVFFSIITFIVLFIGYLVEKINNTAFKGIERWKVSDLVYLVRFIVISISIIVVAVPEGLPLAVTISLAYSISKMMKDKNLVRHLSACETMGGATNICSDKTGTLTLNQMRIVKGFFGAKKYQKRLPKKTDFEDEYFNCLVEGISINTTANLCFDENNSSLQWKVIGNKTEGALILFLKLDLECDYYKIRRNIVNQKRVHKIFSFSSTKKRMSTIITRKGGLFRIYTKGASEIVLGLCSRFMSANGIVSPFLEEEKKQFKDVNTSFAKEGYRTIALAYKDISREDEFYIREQVMIETDLICIGIVAIEDPLRENVIDSVKQCKNSGIFVRMVTGDNLHTAKHIAKKCGILTDGVALEGYQFRSLNDDEIVQILPFLQVLARSSPTDKHKLVSKLKNMGEVVSVTGDGTNDAPALREADVGLSMGLSGTSVAREASDIVILDDDFKSIVSAVLWGRTVFENIRKFLQFQLTVNVVALILTVVTSFSANFSKEKDFQPPLTAVKLLWINIIMDSFGALALATEGKNEELLKRKPYGRHEGLITTSMYVNLVSQSIYQLIILLIIFFFGITMGLSRTKDENNSVIFNIFVFCQIFNEINCRKIDMEINLFNWKSWLKLLKSPWFIIIFVVEIVIQVIFVQLTGFVTKSVPLNWYQWLIGLALSLGCIPYGYVIRLIYVLIRMICKNSKVRKKNKIADTKKRPIKLIRRLNKMEDSDRSFRRSSPEKLEMKEDEEKLMRRRLSVKGKLQNMPNVVQGKVKKKSKIGKKLNSKTKGFVIAKFKKKKSDSIIIIPDKIKKRNNNNREEELIESEFLSNTKFHEKNT